MPATGTVTPRAPVARPVSSSVSFRGVSPPNTDVEREGSQEAVDALRRFLNLDYGQRKQIVLVPDADLAPAARWRKRAAEGGGYAAAGGGGAVVAGGAALAAGEAAGVGAAGVFGAVMAGSPAAGPFAPAVFVAGGLGAAGGLALRHLRKKAKDELRRHVDPSTMAWSVGRLLEFPSGHPNRHTLYVGHPLKPTVYYPFAQFHVLLFQEKLTEAIRLLIALGAAEIHAEHEVGYSTEVSGRFAAPVMSGVTADLEARSAKSGHDRTQFKMRLRPAGGRWPDPSVPTDLPWLREESNWRTIADARTTGGLEDFELGVDSRDDYGVTADAEAALKKLKLKAGGVFHRHLETRWLLRGRFAPEG